MAERLTQFIISNTIRDATVVDLALVRLMRNGMLNFVNENRFIIFTLAQPTAAAWKVRRAPERKNVLILAINFKLIPRKNAMRYAPVSSNVRISLIKGEAVNQKGFFLFFHIPIDQIKHIENYFVSAFIGINFHNFRIIPVIIYADFEWTNNFCWWTEP